MVTEDLDKFVESARTVGHTHDGAVVISTDGTVQEQMVRIKSQGSSKTMDGSQDIEYADWMGTKHMSAAEVSVREEVVATVTLSEENGRVSLFKNGAYDDYLRSELGGIWRCRE